MFAPFPLGWIIKLAPKFKDFSELIAIFKEFQGLEFFLDNSRTFKVSGRPVYVKNYTD